MRYWISLQKTWIELRAPQYVHLSLTLVSFVLTVAFTAEATFNLTLKHPPSRFLRRPVLVQRSSRDDYPVGLGNFHTQHRWRAALHRRPRRLSTIILSLSNWRGRASGLGRT
jgi:hypothetical protein